MDRLQAEAAIARAMELDASRDDDAFDRQMLERLGREFGVSMESLNRAVDEVMTVPEGPLNAAATRTIDASQAEVEPAIESMLRLRGLTTDGGSVWRQDGGWWPDLYRFRSVTTLAVTLLAAGAGTTVRFMARLDRIWRAHLAAAVVLPVVLGLVMAMADPPAWLALSLAWIGLCALTYGYRRQAVRARLDQALAELAQPEYRRQPW